MKANKEKMQLEMARACMNLSDISKKSGLPEPSVKNVLYGRSVRPKTLGKVAFALGIDPLAIVEEGEANA